MNTPTRGDVVPVGTIELSPMTMDNCHIQDLTMVLSTAKQLCGHTGRHIRVIFNGGIKCAIPGETTCVLQVDVLPSQAGVPEMRATVFRN